MCNIHTYIDGLPTYTSARHQVSFLPPLPHVTQLNIIVSTLVLLCDRDVSDVFFRCPRFVSRVPCVFVPALFRVARMADSAKMRAVTSHLTPPRKRSFEQTGLESSMDGSQLERRAEHFTHH